MEIQGKVVSVLAVESGTSKAGNPWQKQSFVIEVGERYPKKVCFQLFGEYVSDCPAVGEDVKVSFDIESREWNGKWFTQLNAWKVERQGGYEPQPQQQVQPQVQPQQQYQQAQAATARPRVVSQPQITSAGPVTEEDLPF